MQYQFDINHISGSKNIRADFLSRFPRQEEEGDVKNLGELMEEDEEDCLIAALDLNCFDFFCLSKSGVGH